MSAPIFIAGIQRSGNSIIAKILQSVGVDCGNVSTMMENHIISNLASSFCQCLGSDPRGQFPLPEIQPSITDWRGLIDARRDMMGVWMYKSYHVTQLWKLWHDAYPEAKWVLVRRKTSDIIDSCERTGYMNAFIDQGILRQIGVDNEQEGWRWWVRWHEKRFVEMARAGVNYKEVWPERMADGDYSQIKEVIDWLGMPWNDSIPLMIETMLWKSKQK